MKIRYSHRLGSVEAHKRIDDLIPQLELGYGDQISNASYKWQSNNQRMDFSFRVRRFDIRGYVHIRDSEIELDAGIPFLARMFEGRIREGIIQNLDKIMK